MTVNEVADATETIVLTAPKKTILLAAVALKFVPVIVTTVPIGPDAGVNEVIDGWAKRENLVSSIPIKKVNLFIK